MRDSFRFRSGVDGNNIYICCQVTPLIYAEIMKEGNVNTYFINVNPYNIRKLTKTQKRELIKHSNVFCIDPGIFTSDNVKLLEKFMGRVTPLYGKLQLPTGYTWNLGFAPQKYIEATLFDGIDVNGVRTPKTDQNGAFSLLKTTIESLKEETRESLKKGVAAFELFKLKYPSLALPEEDLVQEEDFITVVERIQKRVKGMWDVQEQMWKTTKKEIKAKMAPIITCIQNSPRLALDQSREDLIRFTNQRKQNTEVFMSALNELTIFIQGQNSLHITANGVNLTMAGVMKFNTIMSNVLVLFNDRGKTDTVKLNEFHRVLSLNENDTLLAKRDELKYIRDELSKFELAHKSDNSTQKDYIIGLYMQKIEEVQKIELDTDIKRNSEKFISMFGPKPFELYNDLIGLVYFIHTPLSDLERNKLNSEALDASTITSIALKSISSPVQQTMDTIEHDGEGDDYSAVIYAISCIKNQLTCVLHRGPDNSDMYDTINPIIEKIGSVFDKTVICTKKEGHSALENFEKVKKATEFMSRYVLPK